MVLSTIGITVSLNFKIESVEFVLFAFEVILCTSVRTEASQLCQVYTV